MSNAYANADEFNRDVKALHLLLEVVSPEENHLQELENCSIHVQTRRYTYYISPHDQTKVYNHRGRRIGKTCLQLSIPTPVYDRMVAEYLLIKNAELEYWATANFFSHNPFDPNPKVFFFFVIDVMLVIHLALRLLF